MFIRTERLFLRPAWPEDYDDLRTMLEEQGIDRKGALAPPVDPAIVRQYLVADRDRRLPVFMICLRTPGGPQVVGAVGLAQSGGEDAELGYWIVPRHRGRGFATEAVDAVLRHAVLLGHRRLVARPGEQEDDARRVYEAVGFRPTGEWRLRDLDDGADEMLTQYYVAETAFTRHVPTAARVH
ncbi:GNAT family N-acetyltransferase [Novosphingobium colocasiae]|uniref:N-acetyltransferase domain-containing protein n=1 Tax=Novosphingobium colocasiae TaxID=1256513 RepID=A0A918UI87_9SPHN|nr:GNAT family N-acetyltransferase [Novosphingobium colocasiae]GGZ11937.1 hypothetical protein GCM10011614_28650 [Novosphingobium colocasiae]